MQVEKGITRIFTKSGGAYLIKGENKTALIDGVCEEYSDEFIEELSRLVRIEDIDFYIFTHTDSEHIGALEKLTRLNPDSQVIASIAGIRNIKETLNRDINERCAKDGMVLSLGEITLKFIITPNILWPDTLMLYIEENKTLFSGEMFADLGDGAKSYYEKNLKLFRGAVKFAYDRVKTLDISRIYTSKGNPVNTDVLNIYDSLLSDTPKSGKTAGVIYAGSKTGNTAHMAYTAAHELEKSGFCVRVINCSEDFHESVRVMNSSDILCFASPTVHRKALPEIMDVISRIDRVNKTGTPCMITGSYGWGGEALGAIYGYLRLLKMSVYEKPFGVIMEPSYEDMEKLKTFTTGFADYAVKRINEIDRQ